MPEKVTFLPDFLEPVIYITGIPQKCEVYTIADLQYEIGEFYIKNQQALNNGTYNLEIVSIGVKVWTIEQIKGNIEILRKFFTKIYEKYDKDEMDNFKN